MGRLANNLTFNSRASLDRSAWTQYDLEAYKHKHCIINGRFIILKDYFIKPRHNKNV